MLRADCEDCPQTRSESQRLAGRIVCKRRDSWLEGCLAGRWVLLAGESPLLRSCGLGRR